MKYKCPKCGNIFDGQPSFCPHCGTKLNYQTQTDTNLNVSTIANEATKDVKSEAKPYEKYIDECKNYTIISLVTSIIAILSVIIMICVPFINSVLDEKVSLLNIFIQYTKIVTDSSFNTSSTYSYFILINYIYLICIILTLGVLLVTSIIEFVKNIIRLANKKDYAMEFYFNEQKGRDDVSNFFKKGLWRGTNITTNSTISVIIMFCFMFVLDRYWGTGSFSSINGLIFLIILFLILTLIFNVISIVVKNKIKKNIIKEEYEKI